MKDPREREGKTMEKQEAPLSKQEMENSKVEPDHKNLPPSGLLEKVNLFQQSGRIDKALAYLKEAFERSPETTEGKIARVKFSALKMQS